MKNFKSKFFSTAFIAVISSLLVIPAPAHAVSPETAENVALGTVCAITDSSFNDIEGVGALAGDGNRNTAVGVGAVVINGNNNKVTGHGATAGGGDDNTAVGVGVIVAGSDSQAVGYGAQAGNGSYNTAIGSGAKAGNGSYNTAIGSGAQSDNGIYNTAIGSGAKATGYDGQSAFGAMAVAAAPGSVALGAGSVSDQPDTVSVGRSDYQRRITNLAPGIYDTDAVNMSQLRSLESKTDRVGALAFAMSALAPMPYDPKDPTQFSAGVGTYNGKSAAALGVYHYTKPNVLINAAIALSSDNWEKAARFGITWKTGGPKPKQLVPATSSEPAAEQSSLSVRIQKIMDSYNNGTILNN